MKRTIRKEYTLTRKEAESLKKKARAACRSEAALVRDLVNGYEPKAAPGDEFFEVMKNIQELSQNVKILAEGAVHLSNEDRHLILGEVSRWHRFQAEMEKQFLVPEKGSARWR